MYMLMDDLNIIISENVKYHHIIGKCSKCTGFLVLSVNLPRFDFYVVFSKKGSNYVSVTIAWQIKCNVS
jgi:phenylalanyl-tRNA synthetase beta subunit